MARRALLFASAAPLVLVLVSASAAAIADEEVEDPGKRPVWKWAPVGDSCEEACILGCLDEDEHLTSSPQSLADAVLAAGAGFGPAGGPLCASASVEACLDEQQNRRLADAEDGGDAGGEKANATAEEQLRDHLTDALAAPCGGASSASGGGFVALSAGAAGIGGECRLRRFEDSGKESVLRSCRAKPPQGFARLCACAPYDCRAGFENWREGWAAPKKKWCCANKGVACEDPKKPKKAEEKDPYDCNSKLGHWDEVWSLGPHKWCCSPKGLGCLEISNVSGTKARFATGTLLLEVGRPHVLAKDPKVPAAFRKRIADLVGVDPVEVSLNLVALAPEPLKLRGAKQSAAAVMAAADDRVFMNYSVPVADTADHSGPMRLAALSEDAWTDELRSSLDAGQGGYIVTVVSAGEVALSNVRGVPLPEPTSNESLKLFALAVFAIVAVLAGVAMYAVPRMSQESVRSPRSYTSSPAHSPVKSPVKRRLLPDDSADQSPSFGIGDGDEAAKKEEDGKKDEDGKKEAPPPALSSHAQIDEPQESENASSSPPEGADGDQAGKKKKKGWNCLPRCDCCCESKKGASEPGLAPFSGRVPPPAAAAPAPAAPAAAAAAKKSGAARAAKR